MNMMGNSVGHESFTLMDDLSVESMKYYLC